MNYLPGDRSDEARLHRALRAPRVDTWQGHVGGKVEPSNDPFKRLRRHAVLHVREGLEEHRERVQSIVTCPQCNADVELLHDTDQWIELKDADGTVVLVHDGYGPGMGCCCDTLLTDDPCDGLRAWDVSKKAKAKR